MDRITEAVRNNSFPLAVGNKPSFFRDKTGLSLIYLWVWAFYKVIFPAATQSMLPPWLKRFAVHNASA